MLTLSAQATVTSTAEGSRLKCISGRQLPASIESTRKLRSSAFIGFAARTASTKATCGQTKHTNAAQAHAGQPAPISPSTMPIGRAARPMPSTRKR